MSKKLGSQTFQLRNPPVILSTASIVGPMEGEGPLGLYYDLVLKDQLYGETTWEKAESKMVIDVVTTALAKVKLKPVDVDLMLAGDLLNQIITTNYAARQLAIPFLGLYGACSTMAEGMALGSMLVDGGFVQRVVNAASSHYDTAERQYRYPTEFGVQRPPTAQRTVTGCGATVIAAQGQGPRITHVTIGKVVDLGVKDANDMGSAMAPAVADTIQVHLSDTGRKPEDYDLIISGDLGIMGKTMTQQLLKQQGLDVSANFTDCGVLIFDPAQDTHAGGSGCGCSASVISSYIMHEMIGGRFSRVLFVGSGALLSPLATQQGESIPGIGHAVVIENMANS